MAEEFKSTGGRQTGLRGENDGGEVEHAAEEEDEEAAVEIEQQVVDDIYDEIAANDDGVIEWNENNVNNDEQPALQDIVNVMDIFENDNNPALFMRK